MKKEVQLVIEAKDLVSPTLKKISDQMQKMHSVDDRRNNGANSPAKKQSTAVKEADKQLQAQKKITEELKKQAGWLDRINRLVTGPSKKKPTKSKPAATAGGGGGDTPADGSSGDPPGKKPPVKPKKPARKNDVIRDIASSAIGNMVANVAGRAIGMIVGQVSEARQARTSYGMAYSGLIGTGASRQGLQTAVGRGVGLGFGPAQTAQDAASVARATGSIDGTNTAQSLGRAFAMDTGEATSIMGSLTRMGNGFGGAAGNKGNKALQNMISAGMASGLDRARMPEFFQAATALSESAAAVTAGDVNTTGISNLLAQMGMSGKSGLQGSRGGAVLGQFDSLIKNTGGGEAGNALMLRAMGFGKPGGNASYYEAEKRRQQGIAGEGNLQAMFEQTASEYGEGSQQQVMAIREMSGSSLSYEIIEQMREVVKSNMSTEEKQAELARLAEQSKPVEEQALDAMKSGFGDQVKHAAELELRMVEMGDKLKGPLDSLQASINRLVDVMFPIAVEILMRVAAAVEEIMEFAGLAASDDVMLSKNKETYEEINKMKKEAQDLRSSRERGDISQDEYSMRASDIRSRAYAMRDAVGNRSTLAGLYEDASETRVGRFLTDHTDVFGGIGGGLEGGRSRAANRRIATTNLDATNDLLGRAVAGPLQAAESRRAISDFARTNEGRSLLGSSESNQEQMVLPGGALHDSFVRFIEASGQQYHKTQEALRNLATTTDRAVREGNEGAAAATRRGSPATVERP